MYENYLLNPMAIAAVLSAASVETSLEAVQAWINENAWNKEFVGAEAQVERPDTEVWVREVHGANFLSELFGEVSSGLLQYNKIEHGIALTKWICENSLKDFTEICGTIQEFARPSAST
jgi:tRNA U54 and U55 pseudouridine synthase Pus10